MNFATIIVSLLLYGLAFLCFILPYRCRQQSTARVTGIILGILITLAIIGDDGFLIVFIYLGIIIFQLIFIVYWTFRVFQKRKAGNIVAGIMTTGAILLIMSPWIADWMFNKKDVRKILSYHGIELKDDFKIVENESGGIRDYYETFTIKLSDKDYNQLAEKIRSSNYYKGILTDYYQLPAATYNRYDIIDFETKSTINRECFSNKKMDNGTDHFRFQLDKKKKLLDYVGSDE